MDFEVTYSEEQQRFRAEVREWFEAERTVKPSGQGLRLTC